SISNFTPTISLAASAPTLGGTITLTALVAGSSGNPQPAGSMSWTLTGPTGASVSCANAAPTDVSASNGGIPTTSYTCSFPAITAGTYHATANFPGDVNYNSVNSSIVPIVVATVTP